LTSKSQTDCVKREEEKKPKREGKKMKMESPKRKKVDYVICLKSRCVGGQDSAKAIGIARLG
jgi:hypothetical protein